MIKNIIIHFICLTSICLSNLSASEKYKLIDLGLYETDESTAFGIDGQGQVYGTYKLKGEKSIFTWNKNTGLHCIDLPNEKFFVKINNQGQMLYNLFSGDFNNQIAVIREPDGTIIELGSLGGNVTRAFDINDLGQVVGSSLTSEGEIHAFFWDKGLMIDLGTMIGDLGIPAKTSEAVSINNYGQIVGNSTYALVHKGKIVKHLKRAFMWENGIMINVLPIPLIDTIAYGITDTGLIFMDHQGTIIYDFKNNEKYSFHCEPKMIKGNKILTGDNNQIYDFSNGINFPNIYNPLVDRNFIEQDPAFKQYWLNIEKYNDFNDKNQVVGRALNIYGESHAILLYPLSDN